MKKDFVELTFSWTEKDKKRDTFLQSEYISCLTVVNTLEEKIKQGKGMKAIEKGGV
jgi:hypothetical protein